ncbi:hypothetical protein P691DRAFT_457177 [Macrolepiota fuliginosa MF-IS2]|uniref:Uncharacterized protein n=1 Tax=Macrolepiota fuliginosa MF-IS2 TaxID=1400762 RepID=A0A9P6C6U9_9AGAR|nr:hypothetical protein P691DRAFT_457177 [Macrolepiota fuliginosa MF-IS2]
MYSERENCFRVLLLCSCTEATQYCTFNLLSNIIGLAGRYAICISDEHIARNRLLTGYTHNSNSRQSPSIDDYRLLANVI